MKCLTVDQHRLVLERLLSVSGSRDQFPAHTAGLEYTSLMVCFLLHSKGAVESLLTLHHRNGLEWFPATTGYVIVRSLFEVDVTAHYISREPTERSRRYIQYGHVIDKNMLDATERHRASQNQSWRDAMQFVYDTEYATRKTKINTDYSRVRSKFEDAKGKRAKSWSGKSIYEMAKEVNHLEAYEVFYADLSSFTHVNVKLANRFLRVQPDGPSWTQRASEFDVGNVFRYAATFFTCFLELFGEQFGLWDSAKVDACWGFPEAEGHPSM